MHRVRKFIEVRGSRIGYAMTDSALSEVTNGARWDPDPSFNVADAILADPDFVAVLKNVLQVGYVIAKPMGG